MRLAGLSGSQLIDRLKDLLGAVATSGCRFMTIVFTTGSSRTPTWTLLSLRAVSSLRS